MARRTWRRSPSSRRRAASREARGRRFWGARASRQGSEAKDGRRPAERDASIVYGLGNGGIAGAGEVSGPVVEAAFTPGNDDRPSGKILVGNCADAVNPDRFDRRGGRTRHEGASSDGNEGGVEKAAVV